MTPVRVARLCLAGLLAAAVAPAPTGGQDLAAAAEKERARRKKEARGRTYSDHDLARPSPKASAQPQAAPAAPPPDAAAGQVAAAPRNEAYWRARAESLTKGIAAAEARVKKAEQDYAAARTPGSQPLPSDVVTPTGGLAQRPPDPAFNPDAEKKRAELEAAQAALREARRAREDLEEEARKAGIPPGWLR